MTLNRKLIIAGLAVGVTAYAVYKISKKNEKKKISAGQHYQWTPTPVHASQAHPGAASTPGQDVWWASLRDPNHIADLLSACVTDQHLYPFYDYAKIQSIAHHLAQSGALHDCCEAWELPPSLGQDLVKLALFDISFLLDDSLSMQSEGHLRRDALKVILKRAADAGSRFDPDGMEVQWMNGQKQGPSRLRSPADASEIVSKCRWDGKCTPMGFALENMLQMNVLSRAENNALVKPSLVIIITDGRPTGHSEHNDKIVQVIRNAKDRLAATRYGAGAVSFSICAVGNDAGAQQWLDSIDSHPQVGSLVDVTSDRRREAQQVKSATGIELTEELHCLKVLLGGIDSTYDASDEGSPSGAHRQAARKSSLSLNRPAFETFETQRWRSQQQEALRLGVPAPARPPFVKEEDHNTQPYASPSQQWGNNNTPSMPPSQYGYNATAQSYGASPQPYGAPPQPYGAPPQPYGAPPQPYGAPPSQSYGAPAQSYGGPMQPIANTYPASQAPYMNQPGNDHSYYQPPQPAFNGGAFPPPYAEQAGSSFDSGVGGFMMPSAAPAASNYDAPHGQPQHNHKGGVSFPSAFPS